jgi:Pyruvate/2-oxoacid:ferredoxin oxidoreductase delta subunit
MDFILFVKIVEERKEEKRMADNNERITCQKCGRTIPERNFFKKKDGSRFNYCKDCLTTYIKNDDPSTFD